MHTYFYFAETGVTMICCVDGCEKSVQYKADGVCQMHYFRMMRNGSYDLPEKDHKPVITPNGYVRVYQPGHPLSVRGGYVFEHRYVLFEKHKGADLNCEFCGAEWTWRPYKDHVDHIDEDRTNNAPENLRPLCNGCNTKRTKLDYSKVKGIRMIEAFGESKTAESWSRDSRCNVAGYVIRNRIKSGWDAERSILTPNRKG